MSMPASVMDMACLEHPGTQQDLLCTTRKPPPYTGRPSMRFQPRLIVLITAACGACASTPRPAAPSPPAPDVDFLRHVDPILGLPLSDQAVTIAPDGSIRVHRNDRTTFLETITRYELDERGLPVYTATTNYEGTDELRLETFWTEPGSAHWRSDQESGSAPLDPAAPRFYLGAESPAMELGLLARALLRAPGMTLGVLPAGQARLEVHGSLTIEDEGKPITITHYTIHGISTAPLSVWLDHEHRFVCHVGTDSVVIRQGFEPVFTELLIREHQVMIRRTQDMARRLAHRPPGGVLALRHARVFDARTMAVIPRATIVIRESRIIALGPDAEVVVPAGAEIMDASQYTVLPGLWDMHGHIVEELGVMYLAGGVTSVRDLGNNVHRLPAMKRRFDSFDALGPRVIGAGFMDDNILSPHGVSIDTEEEALSAVDDYIDMGYAQIKLYSNIDPRLVPAIARHAHERGLRVSGHVPSDMLLVEAVFAGMDEIQHLDMLFLAVAERHYRTDSLERIYITGEEPEAFQLDSPLLAEILALLRENHTVIDPTLGVYEQYYIPRKGEIAPAYAAIIDRLPIDTVRAARLGGLPERDDGAAASYRKTFANMLALTRRLEDEGIPIVAGSDGTPGIGLHRELELYVEAGIPAPRVLQIATLDAARIMGRDHELGTIEVGKLADLILVAGDPTTDISDIREVAKVIKDGVVMDAAELYAEVSIR